MCVYCMTGDHVFRYDPPWPISPREPFIPQPLVTPRPWSTDRLREYLDLLERIKKMEDQLGCPCEPNKADYIGLFKKRIDDLEKKVAKQGKRK